MLIIKKNLYIYILTYRFYVIYDHILLMLYNRYQLKFHCDIILPVLITQTRKQQLVYILHFTLFSA